MTGPQYRWSAWWLSLLYTVFINQFSLQFTNICTLKDTCKLIPGGGEHSFLMAMCFNVMTVCINEWGNCWGQLRGLSSLQSLLRNWESECRIEVCFLWHTLERLGVFSFLPYYALSLICGHYSCVFLVVSCLWIQETRSAVSMPWYTFCFHTCSCVCLCCTCVCVCVPECMGELYVCNEFLLCCVTKQINTFLALHGVTPPPLTWSIHISCILTFTHPHTWVLILTQSYMHSVSHAHNYTHAIAYFTSSEYSMYKTIHAHPSSKVCLIVFPPFLFFLLRCKHAETASHFGSI